MLLSVKWMICEQLNGSQLNRDSFYVTSIISRFFAVETRNYRILVSAALKQPVLYSAKSEDCRIKLGLDLVAPGIVVSTSSLPGAH